MSETKPFITTRDELWSVLVTNMAHGFSEEPGEHGPGRAYYTLNRDLFRALHDFCDAKEGDRLRDPEWAERMVARWEPERWDELKRDRDDWKSRAQVAEDQLEVYREEAKAHLAQVERREKALREALAFYAKQRGLGSVLASDGGAIARRALADQGASDG